MLMSHHVKPDEKIIIKKLRKNFRVKSQQGKGTEVLEVLRGVDLSVREGEVVCVIGPSGGGKSTLLRCINRLETVTSGTITVDGIEITDKHTNINLARENIGMVFQSFNLFSHLTVKKNITLAPVDLKKMPHAKADELAEKLLTQVGLAEKLNAYQH